MKHLPIGFAHVGQDGNTVVPHSGVENIVTFNNVNLLSYHSFFSVHSDL
jgi:hypothetical protein